MAQISVPVVRNILQANERLAAENRKLFDNAGMFVLNLMSSPGAGKTSLLEKTIEGLAGKIGIAVIEGDSCSCPTTPNAFSKKAYRPFRSTRTAVVTWTGT